MINYKSTKASSHAADFNTRNKLLTQKLLKQGYLTINFARHFLNFIDDSMIWHLNSKLNLKSLLRQGLLNLDSMVTWCIS